ncbi:MAG: hypothetical protein ACPGRV_03415, partial [Candidatus Thalassarchaeaceae archaeon]
FRERMEARLGGSAEQPWREPSITDRSQFLSRLGRLSRKEAHDDVRPPNDVENLELSDLEDLRQQGRDTEAFFLARRMAAQGVEGAKELVTEILGDLDG